MTSSRTGSTRRCWRCFPRRYGHEATLVGAAKRTATPAKPARPFRGIASDAFGTCGLCPCVRLRCRPGASMSDSRIKIRVENATKVYETKTGSVPALEDVSIAVHDGELVCILVPS